MTVKHQNELKIPEAEGYDVTLEVFNVAVSRPGVLVALRKLASHADNG